MEYRPHAVQTKMTIVVDPAPDYSWLSGNCNIFQLSSSSPVDFPLHDLLHQALLRSSGLYSQHSQPINSPCHLHPVDTLRSGLKVKPRKSKLTCLSYLPRRFDCLQYTIFVLSGCSSSLQSARRSRDSVAYIPGLCFVLAVYDDIICVSLPSDGPIFGIGIVLLHPRVKDHVQKHIGQQGTDHTTLWCPFVPIQSTSPSGNWIDTFNHRSTYINIHGSLK